jgi:hypothetical protein
MGGTMTLNRDELHDLIWDKQKTLIMNKSKRQGITFIVFQICLEMKCEHFSSWF